VREAVCVCACVGGGVGVGSSVNVHKTQARELLKSRLKGRRLMLGAKEGRGGERGQKSTAYSLGGEVKGKKFRGQARITRVVVVGARGTWTLFVPKVLEGE
jgi:hypothetical protein